MLRYANPDVAAYIVVYVDDVLLLSSNPSWTTAFKAAFAVEFDIKDLGAPVRVLGMSVVRDHQRGTIQLHQGPYIRDLLQQFHMTDCKPVLYPSPADDKSSTSPPATPEEHNIYRQLIGAMIYLSVLTRPDITEAVSRLCRSMHAPTAAHLQDAMYLLRYLKGTPELGVLFSAQSGSLALVGYSDSNFTTPNSASLSVDMFSLLAAALCPTAASCSQQLLSQLLRPNTWPLAWPLRRPFTFDSYSLSLVILLSLPLSSVKTTRPA